MTKQSVRRAGSVAVATALLAACAMTPAGSDRPLTQLPLFDATGVAHFTLYLACAGQVAAETALCWVPSKYFSRWANQRHVAMRDLPDGARFDVAAGIPPGQRAAPEAGAGYRVVVRFAPYAIGSYTSESDGLRGYTPPKAGYLAGVYVYAVATNALVAQADFHKRTEAPFKADAVPYVRAGVEAIVSALDAGDAKQ